MNTTNILFPSNIFHDVERTYQQLLAPLYGEAEVRQFVRLLAEEYLRWNTTQLLLRRHESINQSDLLRFHWALVALQQQRPIQHIIGHTDFCGCRIAVNGNVLIPRPETEEIVLRTLQRQKKHNNSAPRILDLCTGSGCIAIALKKALPTATVIAVDVSEEALQMARRNAADNQVDITFVQADVLNPSALATTLQEISHPNPYSLIISNPPYVRHSEKTQMHANVLNYEPAMALFVPDHDALCFYRAIAAFAAEHLSPQGLLTLEINEALGEATAAVLQGSGFSPIVHNDFRDVPRSIEAVKQ